MQYPDPGISECRRFSGTPLDCIFRVLLPFMTFDPVRQHILDRIEYAAPVLNLLPGVVIIQDLRDTHVLYMSKKGTELLGVTLPELQAMGTKYHSRFFNPEHYSEYAPRLLQMLHRNDPDETFTFFQQVRIQGYADWQWHLTAIRIFMQDETTGAPIASIAQAQHISTENHYTRKVDRLLEELTFIRQHVGAYATLSAREREVLRGLAQGQPTAEIAGQLFISVHTVETHRKNIRRKLNIRQPRELDLYARAFDLI
jgi:DNA-binding CsgD family transcriptional regulator